MKKVSKATVYGVVFSFVVIFLALTTSLWKSKYSLISFLSDSDAQVSYSVYFTTNAEEQFDETRKITVQVPAGKQKVEIKYPIRDLCMFRLDIDPASGSSATTKITNLRIKGKNVHKVFDFANECAFNPPENLQPNGRELIVHAGNGKDVYIWIKNHVNVRYTRHIDWLIFVSILVIGFFISLKIIQYIVQYKETESASKKDIAFVSLFFCALFLPMSAINDADISEQEKRTLAKKPTLDKVFDTNYNYGALFDKWFSDRFFGREALLNIHSFLDIDAAKKGNDRAIVGKDGWLFYIAEGNLADYRRISHASAEQLSNITKYLSDFNAWCKENGKEFYYFIAPNKHNVYRENYNDVYIQQVGSRSVAQEIVDHIRQHSDVKVIFPLEELIDAKSGGFVYYKQDTHWTKYGASIGYSALMDEICKTRRIERFIPELSHNGPPNLDIFHMLPGRQPETSHHYATIKNAPSQNTIVSYLTEHKSGWDSIIQSRNPSKPLSVFILRDSFTSALTPFLNETFGTVRYHWYHQVKPADLEYIKKYADIVILEQVERYSVMLAGYTFPQP